MKLVVAALLLASLPRMAVAADNPEHGSKNARKALAVLSAVGADSKEVRSFVESIDGRTVDGYVTLAETKMAGGTLKLHYETGDGIKVKRLELKYAPDDSNWQATARTDSVMVNYRIKF